MKKYKLKQTIVVTTTTSTLTARVLKAGTVLSNKFDSMYFPDEKEIGYYIAFTKEDIESTPELFELITDEKV